MTVAEFRRLALEASGAIESAHMHHPDFRLGGRIFASLGYPDDGWGMVKLTPLQQRAFMRDAPMVFHPCAGAWGRQGSTSVHLASADKSKVSAALDAARENLRAKSKAGPAKRAPKVRP